jgi:hypothetical protein
MPNVNEVLSWVPLTEAVQVVKGGLPTVAPEEFWTLTEEASGTKIRFIEYNGQRGSARIAPAGAPPRPTGKLTLDDKAIIMISAIEEMDFTEELQNILCDWEAYQPQQAWALRQMAYQGEALRQLIENLEIATVLMSLAYGSVYYDAAGNILPSSSGAALTVAQGVPANNIGQLDGLLNGDWSDSGFDIPTFVTQKLVPRSLADTNYRAETAFYGSNIAGYIKNNSFTKRIWDYQPRFADHYANTGQILDGFLDMKWVPMANAYFLDQNNTAQFIWPGDRICFMPKVTNSVYTMYHGSTKVPTTWGILPDAAAMLKSYAEKFHRYRFAYSPVSSVAKLIDVVGTKFFPRWKVPGSTYLLDVNP